MSNARFLQALRLGTGLPTRTAFVPALLLCVGAVAWVAAPVEVPVRAGDTAEYLLLARNLSAGHGLSLSEGPPFEPSAFRGPGYPGFIAFTTLGLRLPLGMVGVAALVLQALMAWGVAVAVARATGAAAFGWAAGLVAGLYPTVVRTNLMLLADGPATSGVTLGAVAAWYLLRRPSEGSGAGVRGWMGLGLLMGALSLVRAEMVAFALVFAFLPLAAGRKGAGARVAAVALGIAVMVGPWVVRNQVRLHRPIVTSDLGERVAPGYTEWSLTWMDHPRQVQPLAWDVLAEGRYDIAAFPDAAFLSDEERTRVAGLLAESGGPDLIGSRADSVFSELAREHRRQRPLQVLLLTPLKRIVSSWAYLPTFGAYRPWYARERGPQGLRDALSPAHWPQMAVVLLSLSLLLLGLVGSAAVVAGREWPLLPFAVLLLGRLALMWVAHPEPRYSLEAVPAAAVLAFWAAWVALRPGLRRRGRLVPGSMTPHV